MQILVSWSQTKDKFNANRRLSFGTKHQQMSKLSLERQIEALHCHIGSSALVGSRWGTWVTTRLMGQAAPADLTPYALCHAHV